MLCISKITITFILVSILFSLSLVDAATSGRTLSPRTPRRNAKPPPDAFVGEGMNFLGVGGSSPNDYSTSTTHAIHSEDSSIARLSKDGVKPKVDSKKPRGFPLRHNTVVHSEPESSRKEKKEENPWISDRQSGHGLFINGRGELRGKSLVKGLKRKESLLPDLPLASSTESNIINHTKM